MRTIVGLDLLDSEEILINDQPVNNLKPKDHNAARVVQSCVIYPNMNVNNSIQLRSRFVVKPPQ